ncbi:MAG: hypothetical protein ABI261_08100 [Ginsengibacter sp.]
MDYLFTVKPHPNPSFDKLRRAVPEGEGHAPKIQDTLKFSNLYK